MIILKEIKVKIEVDDDYTNNCSFACSFWKFWKPENREICILFDENLEKARIRSSIRTEECKKIFGVP